MAKEEGISTRLVGINTIYFTHPIKKRGLQAESPTLKPKSLSK
jgi:hypothetical protein